MRVNEKWYTGEQLCELLPDLTPAGLWAHRHRGTGPRGVKVGRRILYPESSVLEWFKSRAVEPRPAA